MGVLLLNKFNGIPVLICWGLIVIATTRGQGTLDFIYDEHDCMTCQPMQLERKQTFILGYLFYVLNMIA